MSTKYVARYEGKIVGTRKTENRTYAYAVIGQIDIDAARRRAYEYVGSDSDLHNFNYYESIVACVGQFFEEIPSWHTGKDIVGQTRHKGNPGQPMNVLHHTQADVDEAKADTAGGYGGYIARKREAEIERFEKSVKDGGFQMYAFTWCSRLDLAQKQVNKYASETWQPRTNIQIVPAEVVK